MLAPGSSSRQDRHSENWSLISSAGFSLHAPVHDRIMTLCNAVQWRRNPHTNARFEKGQKGNGADSRGVDRQSAGCVEWRDLAARCAPLIVEAVPRWIMSTW